MLYNMKKNTANWFYLTEQPMCFSMWVNRPQLFLYWGYIVAFVWFEQQTEQFFMKVSDWSLSRQSVVPEHPLFWFACCWQISLWYCYCCWKLLRIPFEKCCVVLLSFFASCLTCDTITVRPSLVHLAFLLPKNIGWNITFGCGVYLYVIIVQLPEISSMKSNF